MIEFELPVHPSTGVTALGVLPSGRIVWPVLGASEDDDPEDPKDDPDAPEGDPAGPEGKPEDDPDDEEDKPLGPKGERALQAEKTRRREETRKRRELEAELAELRKGDGNDAEKSKREAEQAATAKVNARILRSEIRAAAAGKLSDPKDALKLLDLDQFEVDADGEVDEAEIADAIEDLLKRKPYLAANAQGKPRFEGGADGGARKGSAKPITEEQLKKMSPAEIDKAYGEGKLSHLM